MRGCTRMFLPAKNGGLGEFGGLLKAEKFSFFVFVYLPSAARRRPEINPRFPPIPHPRADEHPTHDRAYSLTATHDGARAERRKLRRNRADSVQLLKNEADFPEMVCEIASKRPKTASKRLEIASKRPRNGSNGLETARNWPGSPRNRPGSPRNWPGSNADRTQIERRSMVAQLINLRPAKPRKNPRRTGPESPA